MTERLRDEQIIHYATSTVKQKFVNLIYVLIALLLLTQSAKISQCKQRFWYKCNSLDSILLQDTANIINPTNNY